MSKLEASVASALALSLALACSSARAGEFDANHHITGDWDGARARLAERGVELKFGYFSETGHNTSGGARSATAYADQLFLGGYFDLDRLLGWRGAEFKLEISNRNGELINDKAGMPFLLQSMQIYGRGNVTRLTQFSLSQRLFDDRLRIKAGRIYPSADFFAMSCAFQHLTFCSGGSSNYISSNWYGDPLSALGAQVTYTPDQRWFFKLGGYDTNPRALSLDQGLKLHTPGGDGGTLMVGELEYKADFGDGIDGDYRVGVVRNSTDKPKLFDRAGLPGGLSAASVAIQDTDRAYYVNLEQQVTRNEAGGGLRLFASLIRPDDEVSPVGEVLAVGGFLNAPFRSRPRDRIGLAFGRNSVSRRLTDAQRRYNRAPPMAGAPALSVRRYEYPIELNYNVSVTPAVEIMPSLQYVRHANGLDGKNATVLGLQLSLNF